MPFSFYITNTYNVCNYNINRLVCFSEDKLFKKIIMGASIKFIPMPGFHIEEINGFSSFVKNNSSQKKGKVLSLKELTADMNLGEFSVLLKEFLGSKREN
jgi:hypothetical protein